MKLSNTLLSLLCLGVAGFAHLPVSVADEPASMEIAKYPLYVGSGSLPPLVMVMLGRDHSMYYEAYNDMTDLDDDGRIDAIFNPAVVYDGIFESNLCYTYNDKEFEIDGAAASTPVTFHGRDSVVYTCSRQFSGNFLNYLTASRMDLVKRILIGGQRLIVNGDGTTATARKNSLPYITRQWIPHDTHAWAKIFNPADYTAGGGRNCPLGSGGCTLDKWTPYDSDRGYMFGNMQRRMYAMEFKCSAPDSCKLNGRYELGSVEKVSSLAGAARSDYLDSHVFVWNWLARESGPTGGVAGGGVGEQNCSGTSCDTGITAPGGNGAVGVAVKAYNLVVQSCNEKAAGVSNLSSRCKKYSDSYNTVGLLQQFSDTSSVDAYFGLITAAWDRDKSGQSFGVIRAPVASLYNQIDQSNGEFIGQSALTAINNLDLMKEGSALNDGHTRTSWTDCTIDDSHTKRVYQRGCLDWGNPLTPLIILSHDYFAGTAASSSGQRGTAGETVRVRSSWSGSSPDESVRQQAIASLTLPSYQDAAVASPYADKNILECQKPMNLVLLDENVSLDWKGHSGKVIADGFEIIEKAEHLEGGRYVFGENTQKDGDSNSVDFQTLPTLKTIGSLSDVRGISVLEPQLSGSLKGAAAAAYYKAHPLEFADGKTYPAIQNVVVAMASNLPKFAIFGADDKNILFIPTCKTPQVSKYGTYRYAGDSADHVMVTDQGSGYTTSCGIGDVFYVGSEYNSKGQLTGIEFRVTYEDNDGGSDFDMDVAASYKIYQDPDNADIMNVEISGYYSDGYAPMILGYVVIGTGGVFEYDHSAGTWKHNPDRTVFFDIMKGYQDGSQNGTKIPGGAGEVTFALQSDPFYDINYVGLSSYSQTERVKNSVTQTVKNSGGHDNSNPRKCYTDSVFGYAEGAMITGSDGRFRLPLLPRVGAQAGGSKVYCESSVKRRFYVKGTDGQFLPSALELTAKYGYKNTSLGNYYYVTNAATLADNLSSAMRATISGSRSSTSLTFPSAEISSDSAETVIASFDTEFWTGEVRKVSLSGFDSTSAVKSDRQIWSAGDRLARMSPASRKVFLASADGSLHAFSAAAILSADAEGNRKFPRLYQGLTDAFDLSSCSYDEIAGFVEKYAGYVLGDATYELDDEADSALNPVLRCGGRDKVLGFHKRNGNRLGAVINSTPQVLTVGGRTYVIFAANDGMVHLLDEATGVEVMAIIPYIAQHDMPKAAVRNELTRYILDGEINVYSVSVGGSQKYIAYGSRGLGQPGVYALDLSGLENGTPLSMMWELSKNEVNGRVRAFSQLGSFNAPVSVFPYSIRSSGSEKRALYAVFGNGYNSSAPDAYTPEEKYRDPSSVAADGGSSVVVVNALSGEVKKVVKEARWSLPDCRRDDSHPELYERFTDTETGKCFANGMNPTVAPFDPDHDFMPEYAYATDLYGNVYRLTMANRAPADWYLTRIFTAVRSEATSAETRYTVQPITTKPSIAGNVSGKPVVVVGTGQYLAAADISDSSVQSIYALEDSSYSTGDQVITASCASLTCMRNSLYKVHTTAFAESGTEYGNFRDIVIDETSGGEPLSYDSAIYKGWVVDLASEPGERVVVNSTVQDRHVYVTTMTPNDDRCDGGGTGHMYDFNVLTSNFYDSSEKSQIYSQEIMSRATTAYTRPSGTKVSVDKEDGTKEEIRKRTGVDVNCTKVHVATQVNGGDITVMSGPQYCPRVESWQYIFH